MRRWNIATVVGRQESNTILIQEMGTKYTHTYVSVTVKVLKEAHPKMKPSMDVGVPSEDVFDTCSIVTLSIVVLNIPRSGG